MGIGDELMAAGEARRAQLTDPRRVQILDIHGTVRWHPVWELNPRIARPEERGDFQSVVNGPGRRPYVAGKTWQQWTWKDFEPMPGEIFLSEVERDFARPHQPQVVIEPTLKARASPNKQWSGWQEFAGRAAAAGIQLTQLGPPGTRRLANANLIYTPDFRRAAAVLANAQAYVGHEGGLHHAAAALGIPGVVIFGGFISPAQTGYALHRNLFSGGTPCGMRMPCRHCVEAMAAITPQMVLESLMEVLCKTT